MLGWLLGHKSWRLFFMGNDVAQEVFNVAYHLKQDIETTWRLDGGKRRQIWKSLKDQYAFEKTAKPER